MSLHDELWCRPTAVPLAWVDGVDFEAVFDPLTGETHFPGELPALILRQLDAVPRSAAEICMDLLGETEPCDPSILNSLITALESLARAELVESRSREIP